MLLHSDIARLVLDYLAQENCPLTRQAFARECSHLRGICEKVLTQEVSDLSPLSIFGKSLGIILNEYFIMKDAETQYLRFKRKLNGRHNKFLQMWAKLEDAMTAIKSFQVASILDNNLPMKSQCQNCGQSIEKNGAVINESGPKDMFVNCKATVSRPLYSGNHRTISQAFDDMTPFTFVNSKSNTSEFSPLEGSERHKKKKGKPKRLSDTERKLKDYETFPQHVSGVLLQNINESDTMAVVGATIMSQMKKCAQNENSSNLKNFSEINELDANVAKTNQDSIVQHTLDSLLQSDFTFATPQDLEFGKELEDLLGINQYSSSEAYDAKDTAENVTEKMSADSNKSPNIFLLGEPVVVPAHFPDVSVPSTQPVPMHELHTTINNVSCINVMDADAEKLEDICRSESSAIALPSSGIATVTDQVDSSPISNDNETFLCSSSNEYLPVPSKNKMSLESHNILLVKDISAKASESLKELSPLKSSRLRPTSTETEAAVNQILAPSEFYAFQAVCSESNVAKDSVEIASLQHVPADLNLNQAEEVSEESAGNNETLAAVDQILPHVEQQDSNMENPLKEQSFVFESKAVDEHNHTAKQVKDFSGDSVGFLCSETDAIDGQAIEIDYCCQDEVYEKVSTRSKTVTELQSSPAKCTRSKMKNMKVKLPTSIKGKTPRIKIKSQRNQKKRTRKSEVQPKTVKKKTCGVMNEDVVEAMSQEQSKMDCTSSTTDAQDIAVQKDVNNSPVNVLAAVSLQPALPCKTSPRKLTLRYGLRSVDNGDTVKSDFGETVTHQSDGSLLEFIGSGAKSQVLPKVKSCTPVKSGLQKSDLVDQFLKSPNITRVEGVHEIPSNNLVEMQNVSSAQTLPSIKNCAMDSPATSDQLNYQNNCTVAAVTNAPSHKKEVLSTEIEQISNQAALHSSLSEPVSATLTPTKNSLIQRVDDSLHCCTTTSENLRNTPIKGRFAVPKEGMLVVPKNQNIGMQSILNQLVQQVKTSKMKANLPIMAKSDEFQHIDVITSTSTTSTALMNKIETTTTPTALSRYSCAGQLNVLSSSPTPVVELPTATSFSSRGNVSFDIIPIELSPYPSSKYDIFPACDTVPSSTYDQDLRASVLTQDTVKAQAGHTLPSLVTISTIPITHVLPIASKVQQSRTDLTTSTDSASNSNTVVSCTSGDSNAGSQILSNLCKKEISEKSLTSLLNETSLTQMMGAVDCAKETPYATAPFTTEKDRQKFSTISTNTGIFSYFGGFSTEAKVFTSNQQTEESKVIQTDSLEASQPLKDWLNSVETVSIIQEPSVHHVCRNLDFIPLKSGEVPGISTKRPRYRKLLPKSNMSSGFSGSVFAPIISAKHLTKQQHFPEGTVRRPLFVQNISPNKIQRGSSKPEKNMPLKPNVTMKQHRVTAKSLQSFRKKLRLSKNSTKKTVGPMVEANKLGIVTPSTESFNLDISCNASTTVQQSNIVTPVTASFIHSSSPAKPEPTWVMETPSQLPVMTSTLITSSSMPHVILTSQTMKHEKLDTTSPMSETNQSSKNPKRKKHPDDSSEEVSLRIITSDEEKASSIGTGISRSCRKRKLSTDGLTQRKKPFLNKIKDMSESDISEMLNKLHGRSSVEKRNKSHKRESRKKNKKKHSLHKVKQQNILQSSSPVSVVSQEKFPIHRSPAHSDFTETPQGETSPSEACSPKSLKNSDVLLPSKKYREKQLKEEKSNSKSRERRKSSVTDEKHVKRRISLTAVPIQASELGGSPLHLKAPSPSLVCKDSPNTLSLVAESLVELSQSRSGSHENAPFDALTRNRLQTESYLSGSANESKQCAKLPTQSPSDEVSIVKSDSTPVRKSPKDKQRKSHRRKSKHKRMSLENLDISKILSKLNYD